MLVRTVYRQVLAYPDKMDTDSEYSRNMHYLFGGLPCIVIQGGVSSVLNKFLNSTFYLTGFKKRCRLFS